VICDIYYEDCAACISESDLKVMRQAATGAAAAAAVGSSSTIYRACHLVPFYPGRRS